MQRFILLLLILVMPVFCSAEIYKWIDEKGEYNFADDLGKVPLKYRDKVLTTDKVDQEVVIEEKIESEKPGKKSSDVKTQQSAPGEAKAATKAKPLFGDKDGESWKREFARQKSELKAIEDQAAEIRSRMANPSNISRGEYLTLQYTVRDLDTRIAASRKRLQALIDAADRVELPEEFR